MQPVGVGQAIPSSVEPGSLAAPVGVSTSTARAQAPSRSVAAMASVCPVASTYFPTAVHVIAVGQATASSVASGSPAAPVGACTSTARPNAPSVSIAAIASVWPDPSR